MDEPIRTADTPSGSGSKGAGAGLFGQTTIEHVQRDAHQRAGDDAAQLGRGQLTGRTEPHDHRSLGRGLVDRLEHRHLPEPLRIEVHQQEPFQPAVGTLVEAGLGARQRQALEVPEEEAVRSVLQTPVPDSDGQRRQARPGLLLLVVLAATSGRRPALRSAEAGAVSSPAASSSARTSGPLVAALSVIACRVDVVPARERVRRRGHRRVILPHLVRFRPRVHSKTPPFAREINPPERPPRYVRWGFALVSPGGTGGRLPPAPVARPARQPPGRMVYVDAATLRPIDKPFPAGDRWFTPRFTADGRYLTGNGVFNGLTR